MLSLKVLHKVWDNCTACRGIGKAARHKVFFDRVTGNTDYIKCDILMIGEAPGKTEDTLGLPFVGGAGKLLRQVIAEANPNCPICHNMVGMNFCSYCSSHGVIYIGLTNLIACRPYLVAPNNTGNRPPTVTEVNNCSQRLLFTIKMCNPTILVAVGTEAGGWLPNIHLMLIREGLEIPQWKIDHPSYHLRNNSIKTGDIFYDHYVEQVSRIYKYFWHVKEQGYYND